MTPFFSVLFVLLISFSMPLFSSPVTCNPDEIKQQLIKIRLDPQMNTNEALISEIEYKYGEAVKAYLIEKHPPLQFAKKDPIDIQTIEWVISAIWNSDNPKARHMVIINELNSTFTIEEYILTAFEYLHIYRKKTVLVFQDEEDASKFKNHVKNNLKQIILNAHPKISKEELITSMGKFNQYYMSSDNYEIGFAKIKYDNPIIVIDGHGQAGNDGVLVGDEEAISEELVLKLKAMQLPNDAVIKLNVCFSGCAINKFELSISEIKHAFKNNMLDEEHHALKGSLLDIFSRMLRIEFPHFNGKVQGYNGRVFSTPSKDVLMKNGSIMSLGNAVEVIGSDGVVLLKKEEMRVEISHSVSQ